MDDAALVEAARNGDDTAWAAIYDRYADKLHDHCTRILRDRDEAADALHDAFLAAARNLDQLRDPSRLRPWMYSICRHTALRRLKARDRVELTDSPEDLMAAEPDLGRGVRTEELTELVWAASAGLSGRDQALLDLHLRQGLEGQDLADAMGTSLNNSYVMLSRMRDQVERSLGALLIARLGRDECDDLDGLLTGWDGHFSPLLRKRVARHVDGCDVCSDRRKAVVSPLALLAAAPLVPAPGLLKARVISSIRNVEVVDGPHVPFTKEGFAVLVPDLRERRVKATWFGAAAVVLLLLAGLFFTRGGDTQSLITASGATSTTSRPTRATTPDGSTIPTLVGEEPPVTTDSDIGTDGGGGTDGKGPSDNDRTTTTTTNGGGGGPGTVTTKPPATTTTADKTAPAISGVRVSSDCSGARDQVVTVRARVTDAGEIASVKLLMIGLPTRTLSPAGDDVYQVTFSLPRTTSFQGTIRAVDGAGNSANATGGVTTPGCPTTTQPPASTTAPTTASTAG